MGLDIYLYQYLDKNMTDVKEKDYEIYSNNLWEQAGKYDDLSQSQKDEIREKCKSYANNLGLDEWGEDKTNKKRIEFDSEKYPEHIFKLGYFRSSYNSSGINKILSNLGVNDLYDIFPHNSDDYVFQPDWEESLKNVNESLEKLKTKSNYRVETITGNIFKSNGISSESEALSIFEQELSKDSGEFNYSNINGHFYNFEPSKVLAIMPGKTTFLGKEKECVYVVTQSDNTWYVNALEIVKDTIEWVLSQENKEQYYLHWSG
jgi:hypothetical protein